MKKNKILVIDDDVNILNLIELVLSREGYQVIRASNGNEVMKKMESEVPDLIVADLMLPGMNGAEIIKYLREEKSCAAPVIFLTAMISKTEQAEDNLGINVMDKKYPTIAKPFKRDEFLELIKKELR